MGLCYLWMIRKDFVYLLHVFLTYGTRDRCIEINFQLLPVLMHVLNESGKNRIWPVSMTLNSAVTRTEQINDMTINNIIHVTLIYFLPLIKRVPQFDKGKTLPWERERWGGERYHGESHPAISTFFWYNFCVQREREREREEKKYEKAISLPFSKILKCAYLWGESQ